MKIIITEKQLELITEQNFLNKMKEKVQSVLTKKTNEPPSPEEKKRTYEALKAEWLKINDDKSNKDAFGEGLSKDLNMAGNIALMNAKKIVLDKIGASEASFGYDIVDEALFQKADKTYIKLYVIKPNNIVIKTEKTKQNVPEF